MNLQEWIASDHAGVVARFESSIVQHVPAERWKEAGPGPAGGPAGSSIEFLVFHTTYHQDLALNTAVRDHPPLLAEHRDALGLGGFDPSAGLSEAEHRPLTEALDHAALLDYVSAVDASIAGWIDKLNSMALDSIPSSSYRLEHIAGIPASGALSWLHAMWTDKPVSWLVQWECIGHRLNHFGEMTAIRNRLGHSPF